MKKKNFWIAVLVVWLVCLGYEYLIHAVILYNQFYQSMPTLLLLGGIEREIAWLQMSAIFLAEVIFAFFFTFIYTRGVESKSWMGQGLRYGVLIWGVAALPSNMGMYTWSRFPGKLLMWWIIYSLIEYVILGLVCAALYKTEPLQRSYKEAAAA